MSLKSNLVNRLAKKNNNLKLNYIKEIINVFFSQITSYLKNGDRIELRGFGSFSIRSYVSNSSRLSKNHYKKVYFRSSKKLLKALNKEQ